MRTRRANRGVVDASMMESSDFGGVDGSRSRSAEPLPVLPSVGQPGADSFPQNVLFEFCKTLRAGRPSRDPPTWSDPAPRSAKRNQRQGAPFPEGSPAGLSPIGRSDRIATPARHRSPGGGRPPAVSGGLPAALARSQPCEPVNRPSNPAGQRIPASLRSTRVEFAGHAWTRGSKSPRKAPLGDFVATFSKGSCRRLVAKGRDATSHLPGYASSRPRSNGEIMVLSQSIFYKHRDGILRQALFLILILWMNRVLDCYVDIAGDATPGGTIRCG